MKIYFDSLGCPKALVDAERMAFFMEKGSHALVGSPDEADAVVVNTCGFIGVAKKQNINAILEYAQMKTRHQGMKLIVTGCLTERYSSDLMKEIPEIDNAIGVKDLSKVLQALEGPRTEGLIDAGDYQDDSFTTERSLVFSGLHYAYLKISEGCNRGCSFCAIPGIRGKQRSRAREAILKEAAYLKDQGIEELIIISEDTLSYGTDIYGKRALMPLLEEILKLGFTWVRVMYLFPEAEVLTMAGLMGSGSPLLPYLDMPLQHASAGVLKSMRRAGSPEEFTLFLNRVREKVPGITIRTAFITGYPGESEEDFNTLAHFIETAQFDRVGFFQFSPEEDTPAWDIKPAVPARVAKQRLKQLASIQAGISKKRLERWIGQTRTCIQDGIVDIKGKTAYTLLRSDGDAPEIDGAVIVKSSLLPDPSEAFVNIRITGVSGNHDLTGTPVERV